MNLTTRIAKPADIPTVLAILNHGMLSKLRRGDTAWGDATYTTESIRPAVENGSTYLAFLGNEPVGTFQLLWSDEAMWGVQSPEAGYVQAFATASGYRGQNIGGQILELALAEVTRSGRKYLRVACPSNNQGLKAYYEKQGFVRADAKANPRYPSYSAAYYERPSFVTDSVQPAQAQQANSRKWLRRFFKPIGSSNE